MIEQHQIGKVADVVGLSLRTIRYYEEIGLVSPSGRTEGGFRLYTDPDIDRLRLLKALKPIGMSLETMGEILEMSDQLARGDGDRTAAERKFESALARALDSCDRMETALLVARQALQQLSVPARQGIR
ncbi:MAG TPA: MerR family transcriptional regulator [Acidimicrobiia bacterium]|nr:MerR family transcriptional regulator [Acidimicrobiia bacterium]